MRKAIKQSQQQPRLILEELEPRRLFSGGIEGLAPSGPEYLTGPILRDLNAHKSLNDDGGNAAIDVAAAEQGSREIVIVDAGVENYQQFVDDVKNNTDTDRDIEVVVLDRDKDGIPHGWVTMMKESIISVVGEFSTARMVSDYAEKVYLPLVK